MLRAFDDSHCLHDRFVELFRNQNTAAFILRLQRNRDNRDLNIPRLRKLERLPNIIALHELRLYRFPDARAFERRRRRIARGLQSFRASECCQR